MQFTKKEEFWEAISKGSMSEIEQLEGKELLDTLEALRTILHPTVRALLESYTIDMVMPIPGIISFLLIEKPKQKRNRINKSQFYDINNSIIPISQGLYTHNPKQHL